MGQIKEETVRGAKWQMLRRLTVQPLQFVYGIILARLITPTEMGIVGITHIFITIAACLATSGFATALIRKLDRDENDCNTMFWFNLGMSVFLAVILWLLAPWVASFFRHPELLWLTRGSAFLMLLSSSAGVHWALYSAHRNFKTPAIIQIIAALSAMPVGIALAYQGYGVWALLGQEATSALISFSIVWCVSPWKPRFIFSATSLRTLFNFGSKLAISGVLHTIYAELRTLIIGRYYSAAALGMYSKGTQLAAMLPLSFTGMLTTVSFPILATLQHDLERLTHVYRTYIRVSTLPIAWVCITLGALATPTVSILYGSTWLPCAYFVQVAVLAYAFDHLAIINLNLLQVLGRSDLFLRLEIIKKTISLAMLLYAATISVEAICWAMVIYSQIAIVINCYYTGKIIGHNWWKQQKDYMPFFILAAVANAPAYALSTLTEWPAIIKIALGVTTSFIIYFGYLALRRDASLNQYLSILIAKPIFRKIAEKSGLMKLIH